MTRDTYEDLEQYVGKTGEFTDDLINYGYNKGRTDAIDGISREVRSLYGNEYENQIISEVIDYVFSELNRLHISYDSEENSVSTTYYDGTDAETTVDIVKGILKENFAKEIKEQNK